MRPRLIFLLLLALALAPVLGGPGHAEEKSLFVYSDTGYANLDPAHASLYRINDERLILGLLECLTRLDPATGKAQPGAAESWAASADRKTWTFKLRPGALWSDGTPVTAHDFIRGWKRVLDPFTASEWSWLFRPIQDCAAIRDNDARANGYSELRKFMTELLSTNQNGIPGDELNSTMDEAGVRPYLRGVRNRSVRRLVKWKDGDTFPPESAKLVIEALKKERRKIKQLWKEPLEAFGRSGTGAHAVDDHTLVVRTQGDVPYLPELLARSAFAPLSKSYERNRSLAFEMGAYVCNGPFILKGRGAKPPEGQESEQVLSVVHLARNPKYDGPNKAQVDEVQCFTDLSIQIPAQDDIDQFESGKLQWVNATWPEYPKKKLRAKIEGMKGFAVRDTPRVLYIRFRCDRAPFRDKEARKAFALSIDREAVAARFWPKATPAYRIVPPGIEGRVEGISCTKPNTAAAKQAFKNAGMAGDEDLWIEVSFGESPGQGDATQTLIKGWRKTLGYAPGWTLQSDTDVRNVIRAGRYLAMLSDVRGAVNDPAAYLAPLHGEDADSGLGWHDEAYDAMIDAALDPDSALGDTEAWLSTVADPSLKGALDAAKGGQAGRDRLRRECLAAAERRLLEEFVIVPVLFLREATLLGGVSGLGSDAARRNPGFVGSLSTVTR